MGVEGLTGTPPEGHLHPATAWSHGAPWVQRVRQVERPPGHPHRVSGVCGEDPKPSREIQLHIRDDAELVKSFCPGERHPEIAERIALKAMEDRDSGIEPNEEPDLMALALEVAVGGMLAPPPRREREARSDVSLCTDVSDRAPGGPGRV